VIQTKAKGRSATNRDAPKVTEAPTCDRSSAAAVDVYAWGAAYVGDGLTDLTSEAPKPGRSHRPGFTKVTTRLGATSDGIVHTSDAA